MKKIVEMLKQKARDTWPGAEGERRAENLESFLHGILPEYAQTLGLTQKDILVAIEGKRDYCAVNYYQAANFPSIDGVRVFNTQDDLLSTIGREFLCPSCNGISTNPYECNAGDKCDWKSYGLLGTLGKGFRFIIKASFLEQPRVADIFMPVALETAEGVGVGCSNENRKVDYE